VQQAAEDLQQVEANASIRIKAVESAATVRIKEIEAKSATDKRDSDQKIADLNTQAVEASRKQQELAVTTETLRKANLDAAATLEAEKRKRLELAVSLLDRKFLDQHTSALRLQAFPGMSATIEYTDEREPIAAAEQINFVLLDAKWDAHGGPTTSSLPPDAGVSILPGADMSGNRTLEGLRVVTLTREAANVLAEELNRSGIEARVGPPETDLPPMTILVRVGYKPNRVLERSVVELGTEPAQRTRVSVNAGRATIRKKE
jgi:hypothetical protein